jgi:hypothetical protein
MKLCNTTAPTPCADPADTCAPLAANPRLAAKCFLLTCAGGVVSPTPCVGSDGVCVPAERLAVAAKFTDDRRAIVVTLNAPAKAAKFTCDQLFLTSLTAAKAGGAKAFCEAAGTTLTVRLPPVATVLPGVDSMIIPANQTVLLHDLTGAAFKTSGNLAIADADSPAAPVAALSAPLVGGCAPADTEQARLLSFHFLHVRQNTPRRGFQGFQKSILSAWQLLEGMTKPRLTP